MFRMWRFPAIVGLLATILTTTVCTVVLHADAVAAGGPCGPPVVNPVACENTLPGDPPSDWMLNTSGDATIQGFATAMSVNVGQTENFKVQTTASAWHMNILRLGYYGGDGARLVTTNIQPSASQPQTQPACLSYAATGLIDCGNWAVSTSWTVPSTAVSGYYLAELVRNDTGGKSEIPFVVRNDGNHSNIVYEVDDATQEAYNTWGGNSLYQCAGSPPPAPFSSDTKPVCPPGSPQGYQGAFAVSYNRPWHTAEDDGQALPTGGTASGSWFTTTELPMIEFIEGNGYDVSYIASTDLDADGSQLLANHKVFLDSGHDEYWSGNQRAALQTAIDGGLNAAFFSGNEMFWKTRYGASQDGSNTPERTLITYKETHFNAPTDPEDPGTWTGAWADPRFSPPADGGLPGNATTGQYFQVNYGSADLVVPAAYAKLSIWRNTAVAKLTGSQSLTLDPGADIIGYEWDSDSDNGFRPPGEFDLSKTVVSVPQAFDDYGTNVAPATITHSLSLYRNPSGALVFGAGTVQYSWGLVNGTLSGRPADPNMQQMVINLFSEMGVQPATLFSGLVPGSPSTDTTPPTSTITSPISGSTITDGSSVAITGTATDAGGGLVAGVEVSIDNGKTWHPVTSMSPAGTSVTWSYSWVAHGSPSTTVLSRAVDDSGNLETPGPGSTVNVNCPCSIWGNAVTPTTVDGGDAAAVNLGVKFTTDTFGTINGLRFYKATANTGTHVGSLWSSTGQLLAQATFSGETASGWQQVSFSKPVPVVPGTTYVASYFAPKGHYSDDVSYFYGPPQVMAAGPSMVDSPPLHALHGPASVGNGVFTYASSTAFPSNLDVGDNYWVDVVYTPSPAPGPATNVAVTPGFGSASVSWTAPTGGGPVTTYTVTPYLNGVQQTTTATVTGTPAATTAVVGGLTPGSQYTFTVTASNPAGAASPSAQSPPVTPLATPSTPTYVQAATAHTPGASVLSATTSSGVVAGARMIVTVGMWATSGPTAASVTDSAGDIYTEVTHFTASDKTDESIWTAPVTNGGGPLTVSVTATSSADIGLGVLEYAGLSPAAGLAAVDQSSHATGKTSGAATVSSGATPATSGPNDLAVGSYVDSGFGDSLTAGSGFTSRANVSPTADIELLMEDAVVGQGATPAATFGTGASTTWLASNVDFLPAPTGPPTAAGCAHQRDRSPREQPGRGVVAGPGLQRREPDHLLRGDGLFGAERDGQRGRAESAGHLDHAHGTDQWSSGDLHGASGERGRDGSRVVTLTVGDALGADAAGCAHQRDRSPREQPGRGVVAGPGLQRREPDHLLRGDGLFGAERDGQRGRAESAGHLDHAHGTDQWSSGDLHGASGERGRDGSRVVTLTVGDALGADAAGCAHQRDRSPREQPGRGVVAGPGLQRREPDHLLRGDGLFGAERDGQRGRAESAGHLDHAHGTDQWSSGDLHGASGERGRDGSRVVTLTVGDALGADAAGCAHQRDRSPREQPGRGVVAGPGLQRREPDHLLRGDGLFGAERDGQRGRAESAGHLDHAHGTDQWSSGDLHGASGERGRDGSRVVTLTVGDAHGADDSRVRSGCQRAQDQRHIGLSHAHHERDCWKSAGGHGRNLGQPDPHGQDRHGLGRQHLHRAAPLHRLGQDGAFHLGGAHHCGGRHEACGEGNRVRVR